MRADGQCTLVPDLLVESTRGLTPAALLCGYTALVVRLGGVSEALCYRSVGES